MDYNSSFLNLYDYACGFNYQEFIDNMDKCSRFYAGDQFTAQELSDGEKGGYRLRPYNNIAPKLNALEGFLRGLDYSARTNVDYGSEDTQDLCSKKDLALDYLQQDPTFKESVLNALSEAMMFSGLSLVHISKDYKNDPLSGDVKYTHISSRQFVIDPLFRRSDLQDCEFVLMREFLSIADLNLELNEELSSDVVNKIQENADVFFTSDITDGRFSSVFDTEKERQMGKFCIDYLYYRAPEEQVVLIDDVGERSIVWDFGMDELSDFLESNGSFRQETRMASVVKCAMFANGIHIHDKEDFGFADKTLMPFVALKGRFTPSEYTMQNRFRAITLDAIPAQQSLNSVFASLEVQTRSLAFSGWIYESGAVNSDEVVITGPSVLIPLNPNYTLDSIRQNQANPIDPTAPLILDFISKQIGSCLGNIDALLGAQQSGNDTGFLLNIKRDFSSSGFKFLSDGLKEAHTALAYKALDMFRTFSKRKVYEILNTVVPDEFFYSTMPNGVRLNIHEVATSNSSKQSVFGQLMELRSVTGGDASPITADILIQFAPTHMKKEIITAVQAAEKSRTEAMQVRQQIEIEDLKTALEVKKTTALANAAMAEERASRAEKNVVDSHSETVLSEGKAVDQLLDSLIKMLQISQAGDKTHSAKIDNIDKLLTLRDRLSSMIDEDSKNNHSFSVDKKSDNPSIGNNSNNYNLKGTAPNSDTESLNDVAESEIPQEPVVGQ